MASSTSGTGGGADEIRYRSYLAQLERQQEADIKDRENDHRNRVVVMSTSQTEQEQQLHKAYDVKISEEAEALDKKLSTVRERNKDMVTQEKEQGEQETAKVHHQYQQKIEEEKKVGDENIAKMQTYYRKVAEDLKKQSDKDKVRSTQKGKMA